MSSLEEIDEKTEADHVYDWITDEFPVLFQNNKFVRVMCTHLLPSFLFTYADETTKGIEEARARVFFEELSNGKISLTDKLLDNDRLLHAIVSTVDAVKRTHIEEQVRWLARAFCNQGCHVSQTEQFDSYIEILNLIERLSKSDMAFIGWIRSEATKKSADFGAESFQFQITDLAETPSHAAAQRISALGLIRPSPTANTIGGGNGVGMWQTTVLFPKLYDYVTIIERNGGPPRDSMPK